MLARKIKRCNATPGVASYSIIRPSHDVANII